MTVLKAADAQAYAARPDGRFSAIMVYGKDVGASHELALDLVRRHGGVEHAMRIEDTDLARDPGRLADEAGALSLLGGAHAVWISGAGAGFEKAMSGITADRRLANLIIASAGALLKTSRLRTLFEAEKRLAIVACYEDTAETLRALAVTRLRQQGLTIDDDALELLLARLGADRLLSISEIEKLALYAHGEGRVTADMVSAVSGDASAAEIDDLIDASFGGMPAEAVSLVARLIADGEDPARLLSVAAQYVAQLQRQHAGRAAGGGAESRYLPRARLDALARHARQWQPGALEMLGVSLARAIRETRTDPLLAPQIASRALLAIAWQSRPQMHRQA